MSASHLPAGIYEPGAEGTVPVEFCTGSAGTGKTFEMRRRIAENPSYGVLAATTGIAAMNLGTITINSLLKYFDTDSLEEAFFNGWLVMKLRELAEAGYRWLVIDELSMMDAKQLDLIYQGCKLLNEQRSHAQDDLEQGDRQPLGIILTGDFCQLPPIKARWAFEAACWPEFEANTTRLTKQWRQADGQFLDAINHIRSGNGGLGSSILSNMGVEFIRSASSSFDGTTIMAKNKSVDNFNWLAHSRLPGVPIVVTSSRWGEQRAEWKHIPEQLMLKRGAYVMILANDAPDFTYVNGDCGHLEDYEETELGASFHIKLVRNNEVVEVPKLTRNQTQKFPGSDILTKHPGSGEPELRKMYMHGNKEGGSWWDPDRRRWIIGGVNYFPLRLAYASTVHKSQGLTLDRIQCDINDHFFGSPSMAYVALSRCRAASGLRIVGSPQLLAARVKIAPEVQRWL